jgi:sugar (pentulose or hexulose) kinase
MDLKTLAWCETCAGKLGIDIKALPKIRSNSEILGTVKAGPMAGVPIAGCLGDQQAALLGTLAPTAFIYCSESELQTLQRLGTSTFPLSFVFLVPESSSKEFGLG